MDPRRITWISVDPCYVVRHRVFGKPWKALELFRFPRVSMIYDMDFPVDFIRKKIPDDVYTLVKIIQIGYKSDVRF